MAEEILLEQAAKEASEVLHSLLSDVESPVKSELQLENNTGTPTPSSQRYQISVSDDRDNDRRLLQDTAAATEPIVHSIFTTNDNDSVEQYHQERIEENSKEIWNDDQIDRATMAIYREHEEQNTTSPSKSSSPTLSDTKKSPENKKNSRKIESKTPNTSTTSPVKKRRNAECASEPTKLEENSAGVRQRFRRGCECQDESCFRGLNPDNVYKHRLNIAELTKAEHDMYLMGVTMACLANPETTVRQRERRRLRAQYVYQGRRVCLDAFLYLENCTHYQLKRIRKHVMTHGVVPRIHGNHGKKPHNTFPLDIYCHATEFLKQYVERYAGEVRDSKSKQSILLPSDVTRKHLFDAYKEYGKVAEPGIKLMGYSTFRHFLKEQFPYVKFSRIETKQQPNEAAVQQPQKIIQPQPPPQVYSEHVVPLLVTHSVTNNLNTNTTNNGLLSINSGSGGDATFLVSQYVSESALLDSVCEAAATSNYGNFQLAVKNTASRYVNDKDIKIEIASEVTNAPTPRCSTQTTYTIKPI